MAEPAGPCAVCVPLGDTAEWGEELSSPTVPEPRSFRRLTRLNPLHYRCPDCGTYFTLHEGGGTFMNSDWTNWTLTRVRDRDAAWVRTHELIRRGDFAELARALLDSADLGTQAEVVQTVEAQVAEGLDITSLEPALRTLLGASSAEAQAAARLLARHLVTRGDVGAVEVLLATDRLEVTLGALYGIDSAALARAADARPLLPAVRGLLASDGEKLRDCAQAIVLKAGFQADAAEETIADATRRLDSPRAEEQHVAAAILSEAARQHVGDIAPALPRLAALVREAGPAAYAAKSAIKNADAEWQFLGGAAGLAEWMLRSNDDSHVHTLRQMQERGEDISAAFEALAAWGPNWPLAAAPLKRAAIQGDDLTPVVAELRKRIEKADQSPEDVSALHEARLAVGILACHFFHRRDWTALAAVLEGDRDRNGSAAQEIVGELTGLVWGQPPAEGEGRRKAAALLAYLSFWAERSDLVNLAFDLELPHDVVAGVLEGLLGAARSGIDVARFHGRLQKLKKQPLAAEIVAAAKPAPLLPITRTEWEKGGDHCQVTESEVVCWSGTGHTESGSGCSLNEFLEGRLQDAVRSIFGEPVFREVLNVVRSRVGTAPKRKRKRR